MFENKLKNKKFHYAWLIFIVCCLMQAGTVGTIYMTTGIFVNPVCSALGFDVGKFTAAQIFAAVATAAVLPFLSKIYDKYNIRYTLVISGIVFYLAQFMMSFGNKLLHWYIISLVEGAAAGIFYRSSHVILLCNWFEKKNGTVVSLAAAAGSGTAMMINPLGSLLIGNFGWRMTYRILSLGSAVLVIPFVWLVIRYKPSEIGLLPYGVENDKKGEEIVHNSKCHYATKKKKQLVSVMLISAIAFSMGCSSYQTHLPNYCVSIGESAVRGAFLTSCVLAGTMTAKLFIGTVFDKIGPVKTSVFLTALGLSGFCMYFLSNSALTVAASYMCGFFMSTSSVTMPLIAKYELGNELFLKVYPIMTLSSLLAASLSNSCFGFIVDFTGSYHLMFIICAAAVIINFSLIMGIHKLEDC